MTNETDIPLEIVVNQSNNPIIQEKPSGPTMEFVDLGLSSRTLWAKWILGATSETEYGGYYAWGETSAKHLIIGIIMHLEQVII